MWDETVNWDKLVKWAMFMMEIFSLKPWDCRMRSTCSILYWIYHGKWLWELSSHDTEEVESDLLGLSVDTIKEPVEKLSSFKKRFSLRISDKISCAISYRVSENNAWYLYGPAPQGWNKRDFQMINQDSESRKHKRIDGSLIKPPDRIPHHHHFHQKGSVPGHLLWK